MYEAREEDDRQGRAIVLQKDADRMPEKGALPQLAAHVRDHEHEQRDHYGQVEGRRIAEDLEDLDPLLEIDEGDVEAEDIAGEPCDVLQPVTRIGDGQNPVEDEGP